MPEFPVRVLVQYWRSLLLTEGIDVCYGRGQFGTLRAVSVSWRGIDDQDKDKIHSPLFLLLALNTRGISLQKKEETNPRTRHPAQSLGAR